MSNSLRLLAHMDYKPISLSCIDYKINPKWLNQSNRKNPYVQMHCVKNKEINKNSRIAKTTGVFARQERNG